MRFAAFAAGLLAASPALAATKNIFSGDFYSLSNSDFVVVIAFVLFGGVLYYFNVPSILMGMLDKRAENIAKELEEAQALREEAQTILASYERKSREVSEHADRIVVQAREEAQAAAEKAKEDLRLSIERRLKAAEDQIASAEASAVKEVRDRAVEIAIAAAGDVLAGKMNDAEAAR
ncbi:MAG: ATP F0F1 synthase subunit B, partial [Pseudomonadota bacterium]